VKEIGQEEGIWDAVFLPEVEDVEARLVARPASSRCTGVFRISRRSSSRGQQDPGEVVFIDLARKKICDRVREVG
jgi:hypothetical protein